MIFCPGAVVLQPFLPESGDFVLSKKFPRGRPGRGMSTAGID